MARILLCWELGGGLGHLARLAAVARVYLEAGHEVWAALRDLMRAAEVMPPGVRLLAAPHRPLAARSSAPARDYGDLLAPLTFSDEQTLAGFSAAWWNLILLVAPDIIVCDHSPTALLAARGARAADGRPARLAQVGNGFLIPPARAPWPTFLPSPAQDDAGAQTQGALLARCNKMLARWNQPPLDRLAALWADTDLTLLTTYPQLDPYAAHRPPGALYCGEIGQLPGGAAPQWPGASEEGPSAAPRVLAYLKPFPALGELLNALCQRGCRTLIYAPDFTEADRAACLALEGAAGSLHFADHPLDLSAAARQCDLALLNGTHAATCALLLAGKPTLQIPLNIEQGLTARAVRRMGAGLDGPAHDAPALLRRLERLLQALRPRSADSEGASVEWAPLMSFDEVARMLLALS